MALNFPSSPTNGQVFSSGDRTWIYSTGKGWLASVSANVFSEVSDTPSANQNDYNPSGFSTATTQLRLNIGASIKLTGLTAGASGQTVTIVNASTDFLLWLENENPSSAAANRFKLPKGFPAFLMPGDTITLRYGATSSRWRVVNWPSEGIIAGLTYFNDCTGYMYPANSTPWTDFFFALSGTNSGGASTGSQYGTDSTEKAQGVVGLTCGTTTTGRAHLYSNIPTNVWGQAAMLYASRVAANADNNGTQTFSIRTGISDFSNAAATPSNGITWELRWNGSSAEWSQTAWSGGAATRSASGSPTPDTTYMWAVIFVNPAGTRCDMIWSQDSVSFSKAASVTGGLPASGTIVGIEPLSIVKSAGTTSRNALMDFIGYRFDGVRG